MKPLPHSAHRRFVEAEGWANKGTARSSGRTGDHARYTLTLATGEILTTKVSHGSGELSDPGLVAAVLRDQLQVTEAAFWACVDGGVLPPRPAPAVETPSGPALDAKLVRSLIRRVGLTQAEVAAMTKQKAATRWTDYLAGGGT